MIGKKEAKNGYFSYKKKYLKSKSQFSIIHCESEFPDLLFKKSLWEVPQICYGSAVSKSLATPCMWKSVKLSKLQ
jgi:hypothetical protein